MSTHESYVSLEVAKLLKDAGFDWECPCAYMPKSSHGNELFQWYYQPTDYNHNQESENFEVYSAPALAVAQRWLREVMDMYIIPQISDYEANGCIWGYDYRINIHNINPMRSLCKYKSYEEALEAGIKRALEMILEKGE